MGSEGLEAICADSQMLASCFLSKLGPTVSSDGCRHTVTRGMKDATAVWCLI